MDEFRSGFACLVGRPNVGKSTLINAVAGQTVAIASSRPQTTRHTIRAVVTTPDAQLVVVDTPGFHRPRTVLGRRLNDLVLSTLTEVDVVVLCLPADQAIGPGDRFIAQNVAMLRRQRVVVAVTKADVGGDAVPRGLLGAQELCESLGVTVADFVPVSARTGSGVDTLRQVLLSLLPEGPKMFPDGQITDQPERIMIAELIREAALEKVRDELPHSLAVDIEEMNPREGHEDLLDIYATMYVERSSQKPIVLGRGGALIRQIGTEARARIEALLGSRVYLDLHVKVAKDWQNDPSALRRMGF